MRQEKACELSKSGSVLREPCIGSPDPTTKYKVLSIDKVQHMCVCFLRLTHDE